MINTREEVQQIVAEEQAHGDLFDCRESTLPKQHAHKDKSLETWLFWMQGTLAEAQRAITIDKDRDKALDRLRVALSLGTNAAMYHGLPRRRG